MTFLDTREGQDYYRMHQAISDIDVTHSLYMGEVLLIMQMMQQFDDSKNLSEKQKADATSIIKRQCVSLRDRPTFETLVEYAPKYDYEFLPALIHEWTKK